MAEPEAPKAGEDDERRSGRERRRPPLTIDLTAEAVPGKATDPAPGAGAGPSPGAQASPLEPPSPSASGSRGAGGPRPPLLGFSLPQFDRETWIGFGSAAAVGGVVALLLVMLFQAVGIIPAPGASAARQAADQAQTASDSLAAVTRRLTAIEAMIDGLPTVRTDLAATGTRVTALEKGAVTAATKTDLDGVRGDVAGLRGRLDQAPPSAAATDVAALAALMQRIETAVAAVTVVPPSAAGNAPALSGDGAAQIAALAQRLDADEAAIARLSATSSATAQANAANARNVARSAFRRAVDAGTPFTGELEVMGAFGPDPAVTALRPYAAGGVATVTALRTDFPKVEDAILSATQGSDDSIFGRIVAGARGLVSVRPVAPIAGSDPPAVVSRMDAAVNAGDIATALKEREALPQAGKSASADWSARAAARVAADAAFADATATGAVNR